MNAEPTKRLSSFCSWRGVWAHDVTGFPGAFQEPVEASLLLLAMPGAPSSFLFLVVRPGASKSFLAPSSDALLPLVASLLQVARPGARRSVLVPSSDALCC